MIIIVISIITILFGVFAIILGIWILTTGREVKYKEKYARFMQQKWEVQSFINTQKEKIKNDCN